MTRSIYILYRNNETRDTSTNATDPNSRGRAYSVFSLSPPPKIRKKKRILIQPRRRRRSGRRRAMTRSGGGRLENRRRKKKSHGAQRERKMRAAYFKLECLVMAVGPNCSKTRNGSRRISWEENFCCILKCRRTRQNRVVIASFT